MTEKELLDRIRELENALEDMTARLEGSWERRDLASLGDKEAVENARRLLATGKQS